jgi:hypothetical protein
VRVPGVEREVPAAVGEPQQRPDVESPKPLARTVDATASVSASREYGISRKPRMRVEASKRAR